MALKLTQILESMAVKWKIISRIETQEFCGQPNSNFDKVIKAMVIRLTGCVTMAILKFKAENWMIVLSGKRP